MLTIQAYLGVPADWKVKEKIKHTIVLMPNKIDIRTAKSRDPRGCALHNAACRIFDIPNCAIGGRWAYIPQRDAKGKYYIARMQATTSTVRAIRAFDTTGEIPEGGFEFIPIARSHTYKSKAIYNARYQYIPGNGKDPAMAKLPSGVTRPVIRRTVTKKRLAPLRAIPANLRGR